MASQRWGKAHELNLQILPPTSPGDCRPSIMPTRGTVLAVGISPRFPDIHSFATRSPPRARLPIVCWLLSSVREVQQLSQPRQAARRAVVRPLRVGPGPKYIRSNASVVGHPDMLRRAC